VKFYQPRYLDDGSHGAIIIEAIKSSGSYRATFRGEELCRSTSPLWRSAQILLERGFPPEFHLEMVRKDWVVSMGGPIGALSRGAQADDS
jgi:hypothetical protein